MLFQLRIIQRSDDDVLGNCLVRPVDLIDGVVAVELQEPCSANAGPAAGDAAAVRKVDGSIVASDKQSGPMLIDASNRRIDLTGKCEILCLVRVLSTKATKVAGGLVSRTQSDPEVECREPAHRRRLTATLDADCSFQNIAICIKMLAKLRVRLSDSPGLRQRNKCQVFSPSLRMFATKLSCSNLSTQYIRLKVCESFISFIVTLLCQMLCIGVGRLFLSPLFLNFE